MPEMPVLKIKQCLHCGLDCVGRFAGCAWCSRDCYDKYVRASDVVFLWQLRIRADEDLMEEKMPEMPVKTPQQRDKYEFHHRWDFVSGKALKDWVTHVREVQNLTRAEARQHVLRLIQELW